MQLPGSPSVERLIRKITTFLLFASLLILLASVGRQVVLPVIFAILFGIVLRPVERFLNQRLRFPRVIAILITVAIFILVIGSIVSLATYELTRFVDDLPTLKQNLAGHFHHIQQWIFDSLKMNYTTQQKYIQDMTKETMVSPGTIVQKTVSSLSTVFTAAIVMPVLLFLVLYYRPLFITFLLKVVGKPHEACMTSIIGDTRTALQGYVAGLFLEMLSVTILQTIAMWIVGVKYFLFIGLITGVLNMIPYIGILIAGGIGMLISLATGGDLAQLLYVVLGFSSVQFIDNNILLPNLVGSRVSINAFFSIVGVIAGGLICGVGGMFLAIPIMALIKVVCDNIDSLKPWAELMGDTMPKTVRWKKIHFPKID